MRGEKINFVFDFKSRQTNKTKNNKSHEVWWSRSTTKKGGKEAESARASRGVHVMCCAV